MPFGKKGYEYKFRPSVAKIKEFDELQISFYLTVKKYTVQTNRVEKIQLARLQNRI